MKYILLKLIEFYQKYISPRLPKTCRYYPTCSQYSKEAIIKYGVLKGVYLSIKRILRCNPLFKGGNDPLI